VNYDISPHNIVNILTKNIRMLIIECSQGCYGRTEGRMDGSITISLRNFVGEGIINLQSNPIDFQGQRSRSPGQMF
jgi:hypothetical protein